MLKKMENSFKDILLHADWISLGGGIDFTNKDYPIHKFCHRLKEFSDRFNIQIYLEPGQAVVNEAASLEVTVLDTFYNKKNIAIVDSSIEAHMLDLLIYRENAKI